MLTDAYPYTFLGRILIATYFDSTYFIHKENIDKSTYILVNRKSLAENPNLVSDIETFFTERYDYFD